MNLTRLIAAVAALSFVAIGAADAAASRSATRPSACPAYAYVPVSPYGVGTARPPWAQPWECFTDEGYGRYRSCSSGRR